MSFAKLILFTSLFFVSFAASAAAPGSAPAAAPGTAPDVAGLAKAPKHVAGQTKFPGFVRLMSYDELIHLPRRKRVAYVHGLRRMMVELSHTRSAQAANAGGQRAEIAMLLRLLEGAEASAAPAAAQHPAGMPYDGAQEVVCPDGTWARSPSVISADTGNMNTKAFYCSTTKEKQGKRCTGSTIPVNQDPKTGNFDCATIQSYRNMEERYQGLARTERAIAIRLSPLNLIHSANTNMNKEFDKMPDGSHAPDAKAVLAKETRQAALKSDPRSIPVRVPPVRPPQASVAGGAPLAVPSVHRAGSGAAANGDQASGTAGSPSAQAASLDSRAAVAVRDPQMSSGATNQPAGAGQLVAGAGQQPTGAGQLVAGAGQAGSDARPAAAGPNGPQSGPVSRAAAPSGGQTANTSAGPASAGQSDGDSHRIVVRPNGHSDARPSQTDSGNDTGHARGDHATAGDATTGDAAGHDAGRDGDDSGGGEGADAPASETTCDPDAHVPESCNAQSIEKARQQYASDKDQDCIYAGNISNYADSKRPYHCVAPTSFCYGSLNCKQDSGDPMNGDYGPCGGGKVICNPLVFGVQHDGKTPFCVDKGSQATSTCDSQAGDDAVSPLDQKKPGLKEAWNDLAEHLFTLCHSNHVAAALHCEECDIISKRLFKLNAAARDVANCGAAIKYEDTECSKDGTCNARPGASKAKGAAHDDGDQGDGAQDAGPQESGPHESGPQESGPRESGPTEDGSGPSKQMGTRGHNRKAQSVAPSPVNDSVWELKRK